MLSQNNEKQFNFWQKWLTWANVVAVIIGGFCAFAGDSFVFDLHNELTQKNVLKNAFTPETLVLKKWLFGIIGGTIVGFHILMIYISEYAFKSKQKWAYSALWFGLISWFAIDSSVSLYFNAWHNVVIINLVALIGIGLPLIFTFKYFR